MELLRNIEFILLHTHQIFFVSQISCDCKKPPQVQWPFYIVTLIRIIKLVEEKLKKLLCSKEEQINKPKNSCYKLSSSSLDIS